jgi:hypothetical protein
VGVGVKVLVGVGVRNGVRVGVGVTVGTKKVAVGVAVVVGVTNTGVNEGVAVETRAVVALAVWAVVLAVWAVVLAVLVVALAVLVVVLAVWVIEAETIRVTVPLFCGVSNCCAVLRPLCLVLVTCGERGVLVLVATVELVVGVVLWVVIAVVAGIPEVTWKPGAG